MTSPRLQPRVQAPRLPRAPRLGTLPRPRIRLRIDPRWIDRIVRGRAWIPMLGVMLVAVVGMRVEVLKLNSNLGRSTQLAESLQASNQVLRDRVSVLSSPDRIMRLAISYGMRIAGPMDVHFVNAGGANQLSAAISGITAPNPGTYLSGLQTELIDNGDSLAAADSSGSSSSNSGSSGDSSSGAGSNGSGGANGSGASSGSGGGTTTGATTSTGSGSTSTTGGGSGSTSTSGSGSGSSGSGSAGTTSGGTTTATGATGGTTAGTGTSGTGSGGTDSGGSGLTG